MEAVYRAHVIYRQRRVLYGKPGKWDWLMLPGGTDLTSPIIWIGKSVGLCLDIED